MGRTKALSVLDLAMFVLESTERMSNIGPLAILKPPPGYKSGAHFADWLLGQMRKLPVGEPFAYVYRPPSLRPLPCLEAIADVDVARHCHRLSLPAPGTAQQLFDLVCKLHVQRLDRSRPPWEFYLIDGLEHGRIAIYAKVHHGIIDGKGFVEVCTRWFSTDPKNLDIRALWQGIQPLGPRQRRVTPQRPLTFSVARIAKQILGSSITMAAFYRFLLHQAIKTIGLGKGTPLPFLNTPEVFRAAPEVKRSFSYCSIPLLAMKEFGKAHGATINDILLTILDMALNRYLREKGRGNHKPLVADMPLALKASGGGNQIAILQFPLGAVTASPAERLREISRQTSEVKNQVMSESASAMIMYTAAIHSIPAVAELLGIGRAPMLANMVISNPFGLPQRCYMGGAEVEMMLPLSVLAPGQSLNITAATYDTSLQVAFLGIAREIPDIQKLADYTVKAFEELRGAIDGKKADEISPKMRKTPAKVLVKKEAVKKTATRKPAVANAAARKPRATSKTTGGKSPKVAPFKATASRKRPAKAAV